MIHIHTSGKLVRDPETKTSKNGNSYTQALFVTEASKEGGQLITLMAFDADMQALLANLWKGDGISAIGSCSFRHYVDKEGNQQMGINLIANRVMSLAEVKVEAYPGTKKTGTSKRRIEGTYSTEQQPPPQNSTTEFDDEIPF